MKALDWQLVGFLVAVAAVVAAAVWAIRRRDRIWRRGSIHAAPLEPTPLPPPPRRNRPAQSRKAAASKRPRRRTSSRGK